MSPTVHIESSLQWNSIIGSSAVVIADFYADWCGPCKMIAPTFESLSTKYSKPKKITFVKVDCDRQGEISQRYSVRAMPTFLIFHNGSVIQTIQGASPPALGAAVDKAVKLAGASPAPGAVFGNKGQRLGGAGITSQTTGATARTSLSRPIMWDLNKFLGAITAFIGLYFVSLFSLDPYMSAKSSPFNKNRPPLVVQGGTAGQKLAARAATFKTLADLGSE
ncbi:thioredoxin-like protein [Lasiosphaeria miniovina]|uniref:Thioredoxin-like protein n=1 Tax=Lasiosphaeria miniovina TaxID=1954250 RepID=A0AA40EBD1_9PEZI|nr:thioredoxin-like protein [Lasiosphaeria miniovina]KAK0733745.1 thioredoxin-like protein [Lasiosphaeria miniovina]